MPFVRDVFTSEGVSAQRSRVARIGPLRAMAHQADADVTAVHFIKRFHRAIRFGIRRSGLPFELWEDAYQDITLRILLRFRSGVVDTERPDSDLKNWAVTIARRASISLMGKEKKHRRDKPGDSAKSTLPQPDELVRRNDAQKRINEALARLTTVQRYIMSRTMKGRSPAEIAEEEQIPVEGVKRILQRGRERMRKFLGGLAVLLSLGLHAQWSQDSIAQDVRQLQRAVHFHQTHDVPDAYTLDSLSYAVIARTVDRLQRLSLPCAEPCAFRFTEWGLCIFGLQTRRVRDRSPPNCAGWPQLERPCR